MTNEKFSWKRVGVATLAAVIVISWGSAIHSYFNPPVAYLDEESQLEVAQVLTQACPDMMETYNTMIGVNGLAVEDAEYLLKNCTFNFIIKIGPVTQPGNIDTSNPNELYRALVDEFERIQ